MGSARARPRSTAGAAGRRTRHGLSAHEHTGEVRQWNTLRVPPQQRWREREQQPGHGARRAWVGPRRGNEVAPRRPGIAASCRDPGALAEEDLEISPGPPKPLLDR